MPFGLTNAPATLQSCMNHTFKKQLCKFLLVFFDDILIYSKTWEEHLQHLDEVLRILGEQSLYAKMSKCEFGMQEMLYLGHVIGANEVEVHLDKIQSILEWPTPKNLTELKGCLGLCTYYKWYVKGFSQLTRPLTDLTKKGAFSWSGEAQEIFERLEKVMSSRPVLALLDYTRSFVLECHASRDGIGAVLMQNHHPIALAVQLSPWCWNRVRPLLLTLRVFPWLLCVLLMVLSPSWAAVVSLLPPMLLPLLFWFDQFC